MFLDAPLWQSRQVRLQLRLVVAVHGFLLAPCSPPYTEADGDEHLPLLEQRALISEQEGEQERADVRAVHVRVGQDDNFGVAKLRLVEGLPP